MMKKEITMKNKKSSLLSLILATVITLTTAYESQSALSLINRDFQDTTGLTNLGGGWYGGVPTGWTGNNGSYSVINWNGGNMAANLQVLGPGGSPFKALYQSAGLLDSAGDVTLTFNIVGLAATYNLGAAIYNAPAGGDPGSTTTVWSALAVGNYNQTSGFSQTLTALNVAANTPIAVAFWSSSPVAVDAVNVIPEPSAFSLLVAGSCLTFVLGARRRRQS